jgi:hypothetical protein
MRCFVCCLLVCLSCTSALAVAIPMHRATNLPVNWVSPTSEDLQPGSYLDSQLDHIKTMGCNTVIVDVGWVQDTETSTTIYPLHQDVGFCSSVTDAALNATIDHIQAKNLKVGMKCHLWSLDVGHGAGIYGTQEWFDGASGYRNYVKHYAGIAHDQNVDTFVIGNELGTASYRNHNWPDVISDVRAIYSGPLSYAALSYLNPTPTYPVTPEYHGWWSGLDYMGINAYYDVTPGVASPTLAQLKAGWVVQAQRIDAWWHALPAAEQIPLVFTEVGRESVGSGGQYDGQIQADYYEAMFSAMWGKYDWFKGTDFWCTNVGYLGPPSTGWSVDGKPAEQVIRNYYTAPEPSMALLLATALLGVLAYAWKKRKGLGIRD